MLNRTLLIAIFLIGYVVSAQNKLPKNKVLIEKSISNHKSDLIKISDEIWSKAETALNLQSCWQIMQKKMVLRLIEGLQGCPLHL